MSSIATLAIIIVWILDSGLHTKSSIIPGGLLVIVGLSQILQSYYIIKGKAKNDYVDFL